VAELAAAAHVPRGYLNRQFREIFGLSASVALEHLRCSRAEVLLTRTDLTIAAIAHQCGYADVRHFSHRFGGLYGIPPSRYRMVPNQGAHTDRNEANAATREGMISTATKRVETSTWSSRRNNTVASSQRFL
jgi:AraC-like DNA-binding protein